jgi:Uma2 family endonuclease
MSTALKVSPAEYLELERNAEFRSEYVDGTIVPMPGASENHILISMNLGGELRTQLKSRTCKVYGLDVRIRTRGRYSYPDAAVVCGEAQFENINMGILLNPTVIFEVLSPSTEMYDRGDKFAAYRQLESLKEYVLVSQYMPYIEVFKRQTNGWHFSEIEGLENTVTLESIDCTLKLSEIYHKVNFNQPE